MAVFWTRVGTLWQPSPGHRLHVGPCRALRAQQQGTDGEPERQQARLLGPCAGTSPLSHQCPSGGASPALATAAAPAGPSWGSSVPAPPPGKPAQPRSLQKELPSKPAAPSVRNNQATQPGLAGCLFHLALVWQRQWPSGCWGTHLPLSARLLGPGTRWRGTGGCLGIWPSCTLGPQLPGWVPPRPLGGPLTQQWLPRGLLCSLPAAGPEVALGVSDLEAGLLLDGGSGRIWEKPNPPQVAPSCGKEVVGDWAATGPVSLGLGWGWVWAALSPGPPRVGAPPGPTPSSPCKSWKGEPRDSGCSADPGHLPEPSVEGEESRPPPVPRPRPELWLVISGKRAGEKRGARREDPAETQTPEPCTEQSPALRTPAPPPEA